MLDAVQRVLGQKRVLCPPAHLLNGVLIARARVIAFLLRQTGTVL
jgi:hypothetical protein